MALPAPAVSASDLAGRLDVALRAAHFAAEHAHRLFAAQSFDVALKGDGTPVTTADREAEMMARDAIASAFPDDGFMGEEFGERPGTSGFRWIVDPIDGTASFVRGVSLWGTMLGLEFRGNPCLGVIEMPALGERIYAVRGGGAWHERTPEGRRVCANVSDTSRLESAMWVTTSHDYFKRAGCEGTYERLLKAVGSSRGWSDCYAFVLLATGRVDAVVEPLVKPWDLAALVPIVEEAGGRFTDFGGARSIHNGNCVASNGPLHSRLLSIIRGDCRPGGSENSAISHG